MPMPNSDSLKHYNLGTRYALIPRISYLSKDLLWLKEIHVVERTQILHGFDAHERYSASQVIYLSHADYVFMSMRYNIDPLPND